MIITFYNFFLSEKYWNVEREPEGKITFKYKGKISDSKSITMNNLSNKKEGPIFFSELVRKDI